MPAGLANLPHSPVLQTPKTSKQNANDSRCSGMLSCRHKVCDIASSWSFDRQLTLWLPDSELYDR